MGALEVIPRDGDGRIVGVLSRAMVSEERDTIGREVDSRVGEKTVSVVERPCGAMISEG